MADRLDGCVAWQCIVADGENAAGFQPSAHELHDGRAVPVRYPAPDAVQCDEVEIGQIGALGEVDEGVAVKPDVGAGCLGQCPGESNVAWIEIVAEPLRRGGCGMNAD